MKVAPFSAGAIASALRRRHSGDLYIGECKNGPTIAAGSRPIRLDGWAFLKTWSPVTSIGYEIKVSRGDFLQDQKWPNYLRLCHLFYFVAPKGLIQLEELPANVGLIEAIGGQNGKAARLVTRRKAARHEPDPAAYQSLLHYVLMCRVKAGGTWVDVPAGEVDPADVRSRRVDSWAEWVENEKTAADVGRRVSAKVREALDKMRAERDCAARMVDGYERIRATLRDLGFDPDVPVSLWGIDRQLKQAISAINPTLLAELARTRDKIEATRQALEAIVGRGSEAA